MSENRTHRARTALITPVDYVAIDLETTGLDVRGCDIIEVAAIRVRNGKETSYMSSLVRPWSLPIDPFIEELTGITSEMLEDAPLLDNVIGPFLDFIGDDIVVGHNVSFDANFLSFGADRLLSRAFDPVLVDTMRISRHVFKQLPHHRLHDIIEKSEEIVGEEAPGEQGHRALSDARNAAFCFEVMKPLLIELYGEDPEAGFRNAARSRTRIPKAGELEPTVSEIDDSNPFYGATICFTGALSSLTRAEAMQAAVNLGAIPKNTFSAKLDYLVVGTFDFNSALHGEPSSKLKKARDAISKGSQLQIASEDFFIQYLSDRSETELKH